jgi:hypothetical protein
VPFEPVGRPEPPRGTRSPGRGILRLNASANAHSIKIRHIATPKTNDGSQVGPPVPPAVRFFLLKTDAAPTPTAPSAPGGRPAAGRKP